MLVSGLTWQILAYTFGPYVSTILKWWASMHTHYYKSWLHDKHHGTITQTNCTNSAPIQIANWDCSAYYMTYISKIRQFAISRFQTTFWAFSFWASSCYLKFSKELQLFFTISFCFNGFLKLSYSEEEWSPDLPRLVELVSCHQRRAGHSVPLSKDQF